LHLRYRMTEENLFIITYSLNTVVCLLVTAGLLFLKPLRNVRNRKYRNACRILAFASAIVGSGHLLTLLVGDSTQTDLGLLSFPVIVIGASQSLLFTFLLILLFREEYVTRKNILLHASPAILLTVFYLAARCFFEDPAVYTFSEWAAQTGNPVLMIRTVFALVYLVQMGIYTHIFFRERAIYDKSLSHLQKIPERLELRWVTRVFLYALGIGVLALTLCFCFSVTYELTVVCIFTVFYLMVGAYYVNYHFTYDFMREELFKTNAVLPEEKEEKAGLDTLVNELAQAQDKDLYNRAEKMMREDLLFTNPDFNRKEFVQALYTNEHYLTRALKYYTGMSIQDYIVHYRIDYAHTCLLIPDARSIEEIALASGFSSVRSFNRNFSEVFGMTPHKYRKEHANKA
ncbi:helix-turn-helix domain-containing protein, partial [Parabacteroides goldsteinii]